jgi:hypothetical protein
VCRREEAAPVSGDWQFKADPFVIEAYRDSGTEAVIWALWRLWDGSERSFYFAPSMDLWLKYPTSREDGEDAEIDALAVVDGKVYQLEAKSAARLDEKGQVKLILAAERIRPDVVAIATMERVSGSLQRALERIRANLPKGIELQVLTFDPKDLERTPYVSG